MTYELDFSEYFLFDDLTTRLARAWQRPIQQLASLESIGKSWQGRDVWAMTLTNSATGAAG